MVTILSVTSNWTDFHLFVITHESTSSSKNWFWPLFETHSYGKLPALIQGTKIEHVCSVSLLFTYRHVLYIVHSYHYTIFITTYSYIKQLWTNWNFQWTWLHGFGLLEENEAPGINLWRHALGEQAISTLKRPEPSNLWIEPQILIFLRIVHN